MQRRNSRAPGVVALVALILTLAATAPVAAEVPTHPREVLRWFYREHGDTLRHCTHKLLGADARRLPTDALTYAAHPDLDFARTRERLSRLRARHHGGRLVDGLTVPPPLGGNRGTILIVREHHPSASLEGFLRTYVHELGNLLDYLLHPDLASPRLMRHYGRRHDASGDDDTGQQLERCVSRRGGFAGRLPGHLLASRGPAQRPK